MSFFSLLAALLLEHLYPLVNRIQLYAHFTRYADFLERHFNAGQSRHGMIAWMLAVVPPVAAIAVAYYVLYHVSPLLGWVLNAAVLYATMGFKYFSNTAGGIGEALRAQDLGRARSLLGGWRERPADELETGEIARVTIEQTLAWGHRQIFAVLLWFVVLGAAGAVLYRLSSILTHRWGELERSDAGDFGRFAARFFAWVDWIPVRLSAIGFAVVGDFEDAMYCWRSQAASWAEPAQGIILAAGAGALGVKLGEPLHHAGSLEFRPELGLGDEADPDYIESAVSLIWRALVLWLAVLALLQIGQWVGG
jgi:cobalamin biosynthesis protein CobD/CbiB